MLNRPLFNVENTGLYNVLNRLFFLKTDKDDLNRRLYNIKQGLFKIKQTSV